VLVEPEIPWNTGNAGRTCLAAGARLHLVEPLGFSLDERRIRRAGLDYWPQVEPTVWPSWEALERSVPDTGAVHLYSAEAGLSYWDVRYPPTVILVFGRESSGLPEALRRRYADRLLRIPQAGGSGVRSLNLSTAVGLALFEVVRQRAGNSLK
jgi:tRNA (cytidine/uridine-2'-O-)-methyltransferase